jgi:acyl carrier protein phosphodiesterase
MNYLAHAYLSFDDPEILVGNMISDFVKGSNKFSYPTGIQNGIRLHRSIDAFTDHHPVSRELALLFHPHYGRYAGPIMDVVYDHFLANYTPVFPGDDILMRFSQDTYGKLDAYTHLFPERFARMFPYMRSQNWLYHYRNPEGLRSSLGGLQRRARYITETDTAYRIVMENQASLEAGFTAFFPDVLAMVRNHA